MIRFLIVVVAAIGCVSCRTEMYGVYTVDYKHRIDSEKEVRVMVDDDSVMIWIEHCGEPIAQMRYYSNVVDSAITAYRSTVKGQANDMTMFCNGYRFRTVRNFSDGTNTTTLMDLHNDGYFPEQRVISNPTNRIVENVKPVFTLKRETDKTVEPSAAPLPRAPQTGHSEGAH